MRMSQTFVASDVIHYKFDIEDMMKTNYVL